MLPFAHRCHGTEFIFQQDNASIYSSHKVTEWFKAASDDFEGEKICVMDWPSKSLDLSLIENLWDILARMVYHHGRQFNSRHELSNFVKKCWNEITVNELRNLIQSMPKRCVEVIEKKGGLTSY